MVGGIAVMASIVRLYALWIYTVMDDVPHDALYARLNFAKSLPLLTTDQILFLSQIEVNVAIILASAPALRPLFKKVFPSSYIQPSTPYGVNSLGTDGHRPSAPNRQVELHSYPRQEMPNKHKPTKRCSTRSTSQENMLEDQGSGIAKRTDVQIDIE